MHYWNPGSFAILGRNRQSLIIVTHGRLLRAAYVARTVKLLYFLHLGLELLEAAIIDLKWRSLLLLQ